jgi:hypothetical protein
VKRRQGDPVAREYLYIGEEGKIVMNPVNQGTFNFCNPPTDRWGHFINDMVPYYIYENTPEDPTTIFERITGTYTDDVDGRSLPNSDLIIMTTAPRFL